MSLKRGVPAYICTAWMAILLQWLVCKLQSSMVGRSLSSRLSCCLCPVYVVARPHPAQALGVQCSPSVWWCCFGTSGHHENIDVSFCAVAAAVLLWKACKVSMQQVHAHFQTRRGLAETVSVTDDNVQPWIVQALMLACMQLSMR